MRAVHSVRAAVRSTVNAALVTISATLMGATAVARFQPFQVRVPQARPATETLQRVRALVEAGDVRPVIDRTFPLTDVPAAIRYLEVEHARAKVVITVD